MEVTPHGEIMLAPPIDVGWPDAAVNPASNAAPTGYTWSYDYNGNRTLVPHLDFPTLVTVPPSAGVSTTGTPDINSSHFLDLLGNLFLPTSKIQPLSVGGGGSGGGGGGPTVDSPSLLDTIRPYLPLVMIGAGLYLAWSIFFKK